MVQGSVVLIAAFYELFIMVIMLILVLLTFIKYLQFRNRLTLYLFLIFFNLLLAIFFSWFSKIIVLTTDIDYLYNEPTREYPSTPLYLIYLRIVDFRIALAVVAISSIFSYVFKINVFEEEKKLMWKLIFYGYAGFCVFFSIVIYERGNTLLDAINFLFIFLLISMVYLPFMKKSLLSYRSSEDVFIKRKLLSLALMAFNFTCVFLCFLIDRIWVLLGAFHFTIFYFLAWLFTIGGIVCAYFGYIKPKRE
ncbi:MAG TPA: hypothetical protein VGB37_15060 [Candidatus Lokiarchaeia archaeon]